MHKAYTLHVLLYKRYIIKLNPILAPKRFCRVEKAYSMRRRRKKLVKAPVDAEIYSLWLQVVI